MHTDLDALWQSWTDLEQLFIATIHERYARHAPVEFEAWLDAFRTGTKEECTDALGRLREAAREPAGDST